MTPGGRYTIEQIRRANAAEEAERNRLRAVVDATVDLPTVPNNNDNKEITS